LVERFQIFIEYKVFIPKERDEQGIINSKYIMSIEIEQHGGGYGKAITIYYHNSYEGKCIFILDNEVLLNKVYRALSNSLIGITTRFDENELTGYIRPLKAI
jgi:hypothetical protein